MRCRAKRLHDNPKKVYAAAHREGVEINHHFLGEFLLISKENIFGIHTNVDGTVMLHVRNLVLSPASNDEPREEGAA